MVDCPDPEGKPIIQQQTSNYYKTCNLPKRLDFPNWFHGYGIQRRPPEHPFYRSTSSDYGRYAPTIHTVPTSFYPRNQEFTRAMSKSGNYRCYSLNTGIDSNYKNSKCTL